MRTSLLSLALLGGSLVLASCGQSAPTAPTAADPAAFTPPPASMQAQPNGQYSFAAGAWTINLDVNNLSATVENAMPARSALANGDLFALPIDQFFGGDALQVTGVSLNGDLDLVLDIEIAHPFRGPNNLEGPPSASNRADLGVAGQFFVRCDRPSSLVDNEMLPNHEGDYQWFHSGALHAANVKLVENANGYGNPSGQGNDHGSGTGGASFWEDDANVLHPYILLIDDASPQCRISTSLRTPILNESGSQGNYDPTTGWDRRNIGSSAQENGTLDWYGYGVLHQGQTAVRQLVLDLDELSQISFGGKYALDTALVATYTDPRQGSTSAQLRARRLPTEDPADFAYRMPFGAIDASKIYQQAPVVIGPNVSDTATLHVCVVDEDHTATINPEFPRPEGAGLQEVPTDSTITGVSLCIPDFDIIDLPGTLLSGTGSLTDPLVFEFTVTNNTGSNGGFDQINHGFVHVTDADDANGTDPTIYLDASLVPITTNKKHTKSGHVTLLK